MSTKKQGNAKFAKNRATKRKSGSSTPSVDAEKPENPLLEFQRFWLPGDADEPPPAPEHFEQWINLSLQNLAGRNKERWTEPHRVVWASGMAIHLIDWLYSRAFHGDEVAQGQVADVARKASRAFINLARKEAPGLMSRVRRWPDMPGFISVVPELGKDAVELCKRLKQGEHYPFPLSRDGKAGKPLKLSDAHHELVDRLHVHIESYRGSLCLLGGLLDAFDDWSIHPLVRRMMNMPPLSVETITEWKAMGREILLDSTSKEPLEHSAFKPGGRYESLGTLDRRGEPNLWKRWREAWQLRAESMKRRIAVSSPDK